MIECVMIPIAAIADTTKIPLERFAKRIKVQRIRAKLRAGIDLPPIHVTRLTPEDRVTYRVLDPTKLYYLHDGRHRRVASICEGRAMIAALILAHSPAMSPRGA